MKGIGREKVSRNALEIKIKIYFLYFENLYKNT